MKSNIRLSTLIFALLMASTSVHALDFGKLSDSVDKDKAAASVDTNELKDSVSSDGVDTKKAVGSVDKTKAAQSVDTEKAKSAFGY